MQSLGHPATWPTECFIAGGCGALVFAHTNGHGDFVLLDELGPPWPIHGCYEERFLLQSRVRPGVLAVRPDRLDEYRTTSVSSTPPAPQAQGRDITRVDP